jgi:hypothetical protein
LFAISTLNVRQLVLMSNGWQAVALKASLGTQNGARQFAGCAILMEEFESCAELPVVAAPTIPRLS